MVRHTHHGRTRIVVIVCLGLLPLPSSASAVGHVVHISIDGLRGDLLKANINASPFDHPNFMRFVDEGATTFNARTDYTNTRTLPNHASMLTGRPVDQPNGTPNTTHHGYTSNGVPPPSATLHNSGNSNLSYVASTFDVVHDKGLSTALYATKAQFSIFEQSYTANTGAPDTTGTDDGRDKIDAHLISPAMHDSFLIDLAANEFNYSFIHYFHPDGVGHNAGWESAAWNDIVELIDDYVGDIFDVVDSNVNLADDTIVVLTADHGGKGTGHGTASDPENYTIPVLVWGAGVAPGADLYALNPNTRLDPGAGRPSYQAARQPIRNGGTGNLALQLLGLGSVLGSTINANQDLSVASAFAADFDGNQVVNSVDFSIWQSGYGMGFGATKASGDANLNGSVNGLDFLTWQQQHGSSLVSKIAAVPEPTGLPSILVATYCWLWKWTERKLIAQEC